MVKRTMAALSVLFLVCFVTADVNLAQKAPIPVPKSLSTPAPVLMTVEAQTALVKQYCQGCHNDKSKSGSLTLENFDFTHIERNAETAEKIIRKLRAGLMPPSGARRPDSETIKTFAKSMETSIDRAAALKPVAGERVLQRLNRAEYANSIRELLQLDVDVSALLPPDSMGRGFDNIADVLTLSPTLMEGYIRAASKISRVAIGDTKVAPSVSTYNIPRTASQMRHSDGAPFGTRGGISVVYNFPADGEYIFRMDLWDDSNGILVGTKAEGEKMDVSVDGERIELLDINPKMTVSTGGVFVQTQPFRVSAGPQRVAAAFIDRLMGPVDDLIAPIEHTLADTEQSTADGITILPHLKALAIRGPFNVTGVTDTPSRRKIFTCRPLAPNEEANCANEIVKSLASRAYRRPATPEDLEGLMSFYHSARAKGDFESSVRAALEAILANPSFVFRFEKEPVAAKPGQTFRISDIELASRLSYFLWSTSPDEELLGLARQNRLHEPAVLSSQVKRMLANPRAETLSSRFAMQWLHMSDLDVMHPDPLLFPQFDSTLAQSMRTETEMFFDSIVREDRNVMDLLTADYTFVDERLGKHYGIPNIEGNRFRRIKIESDYRRGLLGQGSILTLTSIADRTSPVARGKFVMEVLLGTPPPPPPPNVPDLDETKPNQEGKLLTVRQRMEQHRANATCAGCHRMMDPIGLAMENFDVTGKWREFDNGNPVDTAGELYDGTKLDGPNTLRQALVGRSDAFVTNFTEKLMMYGLGRRVEYYDMPAVRAIARKAGQNNNRFSAFVLGIIESPQFQMRTVQEATSQANGGLN
jgi:hypothetical protein